MCGATFYRGIIIVDCRRSSGLTKYRFQLTAFIKSLISYRSNAIANCNTCQRGATIECRVSNRSNAIRNYNTCQRGATIKGSIFLSLHNYTRFPTKMEGLILFFSRYFFPVLFQSRNMGGRSICRPCYVTRSIIPSGIPAPTQNGRRTSGPEPPR